MKAILMDREGTLIADPAYDRVDAPEKVHLLPDTPAALELLARLGYAIIVITNQTNIAQGRLSEERFWEAHNRVLELLEPTGIEVLKTYLCPHAAADNCACRKPEPTLLLTALEEFHLNPEETFMVGDRDTDVAAGNNAGLKTILVKTGKHPAFGTEANYIADNLLDAAEYITEIS